MTDGMKTLTPDEYNALSAGPHNAKSVGLPPEECLVLFWKYGQWEKASHGLSEGNWWLHETQVPCQTDYPVEDYPIWRKLPADYVEGRDE